jgi:hypothetical protein
MYETIDEPVKVIASFDKGLITPHKFSWRNRVIQVDRVGMIHRTKDGAVTCYAFSVSSGSAAYKLLFNIATLKWTLQQVYQEN